MRYGSVCSGIEAATAAWHPLGWQPAFFSEIEAFPRAVLSHHYPTVPLHGDFTTIKGDEYGPIDLLVGGTPCQSFSIAGLRGGLGDDRGNLALEYLRLADRTRPRWLVWENVPGVLSSNGGRDFGSILGGMAELGYGVAYRVLDAQYVRVDGHGRAVPQRRRRVFVVGYLGDWRRAAAVLFDRESLSGNSAPRRETGQVAPTIPSRSLGGGGLGTNFDCDGGLIAQAFGGNNSSGPIDVATAVNAHGGPCGRMDFESETFVAHSLRGEGFDASEDGTGRGTPLVPVAYGLTTEQTPKFKADCALTLTKQSPTGGGQPQAVAFAIQERAVSENIDAGPQGKGYQDSSAYTLEARNKVQATAYDLRGREGGAQFEGPHDTANIRAASGGSSRSYVATWAVRRLMPVECERLQAFPDGYTDVPYRSKPASDGPRYKALGNSMAVNVMRRIGRRIEYVEALAGIHTREQVA